MTHRRSLLALAMLPLAALFAAAQGYPAKPIRLVVPFPAGGGSLGSAEVAKAAPDGYTLPIATSSTHAIGPHLNPKLGAYVAAANAPAPFAARVQADSDRWAAIIRERKITLD